MRFFTILTLAALLGSVDLAAQKQATTLVALSARTPLILRVRVQARETVANRVRLKFSLVEALRGKPSVPLAIEEIQARHCGSACHGLDTGARLILFGSQADGRLHLRGGARGLVHENEARLTALRGLMTDDAAARARLVVQLLDHGDTRLAEDAALSLSTLKGLAKLGAAEKKSIEKAIAREMKKPSVRLYGLLLAGPRAVPTTSTQSALTLWFDAERTSWHSLAREVLLHEVSRPLLARTISSRRLSIAEKKRTARLFFDVRAEPVSERILRTLASDTDRSVTVEAVASLVSRTDATPTNMPRDPAVLAEARKLVAARLEHTRKFRAIRPRNGARR